MPGAQTSEDSFEYYRYTPSFAAAVTALVLFTLTAILHTYQLIRTQAWILLPLVIGAWCESIAYSGRIIASQQAPNFTIGPFIMQSLLTLLGPVLFAATIYMCLGRIVRVTGGEAHSLIRPTWLTRIFVIGDVVGLLVQSGGAGFMAAGGGVSQYYTGEKIIIAGLAELVVSFGLFFFVAVLFNVRMQRAPTLEAQITALDWRWHLRALYASSTLIFVRSIFRLVEFSEGNNGWLIDHEWTFYVFDSLLMFAVLVLFNFVHPSHVKALLQGGKYSTKAGLRILEVQEVPMTEREMAVGALP